MSKNPPPIGGAPRGAYAIRRMLSKNGKNNCRQREFIIDVSQLIILFGGSWGSTLSFAYAETYPDNISGMVLRGIWLATKEEEKHFWNGIPNFFPEMYESLTNALPNSALPPNSFSVLKLMQSKNQVDRKKYAKLVSRYENKVCGLNVSEESLDEYYGLERNMNEIYTSTLLEHYYASNGCFLEEGQLLRDTYRI